MQGKFHGKTIHVAVLQLVQVAQRGGNRPSEGIDVQHSLTARQPQPVITSYHRANATPAKSASGHSVYMSAVADVMLDGMEPDSELV